MRPPRRRARVSAAAACLLVGLAFAGGGQTLGGETPEKPGLNVLKVANTDEVRYGAPLVFTITVWNAGPDELTDVHLRDDTPFAAEPSFSDPTFGRFDAEILNPDADDSCTNEFDVDFDWIECNLGTLPVTSFEDGKVIIVSGSSSLNDCGGAAENSVLASSPDEPNGVRSTAIIAISDDCPTLELVPDTEVIALGGTPTAPTVTPGAVTWTLRWTVPEWAEPIEDGVLQMYLEPGLLFVGASNSGQLITGGPGGPYVEWPLPTTHSGSVTLVTEIDPFGLQIGTFTKSATLLADRTGFGNAATIEVVAATAVGTPNPSPTTPSMPLPDTAIPAP